MKTVILTSSGFLKPVVREAIQPYLPQDKPLKVGYVATASLVVKDDTYAKRDVKIIEEELGFSLTEIDLVNGNNHEISEVLQQQDAVYVQGGNGFYLLKQARRTGFMEITRQLVESGKLIYMGKSAGSYLACPSLEVHTWHSDKWNRYGIEDLTAMNLVPFLIQAHYSPEDDPAILAGLRQSKYDIKLLTNEQALIIQNDKVRLVGQGDERRLQT